MKAQVKPTRSAKFIGGALLAGSLFASLCGCAPTVEATPKTGDNSTLAASASKTAEPDLLLVELVRYIDGDTVELKPEDKNNHATGEPNITLHILGIDAPALDACGGPEALAALKKMSENYSHFKVEYDPRSPRKDSVGNVQGYLITAVKEGDAGHSMVRTGYADAWYAAGDPEPESFAGYKKLAQTAKAEKSGAWKTCDTLGH